MSAPELLALGVSAPELLALGAAMAVASFTQGTIGFGFALVTAPVLTLIEPDALPAALLLLALPMNVFVIGRERGHVDRRGAGTVVVGMIAGTAAGVLVLRAVPSDRLTVAFGAAILIAVGASALHPGGEPREGTRLIAGFASGAVTTVATTGGPFIALLYQRARGPVLRSTLATAFLASSTMSLAAQAIAGRLGWFHVRIAAAMAPGMIVGLWASTYGRTLVDMRWLRPAVLVFAAVSGAGAIVRALL